MDPKIARPVKYVDFGFASAREFWAEVVVPACERFNLEPNRANAITASLHAWHVHDWIWHEQNPGVDTRNNCNYAKFKEGPLLPLPGTRDGDRTLPASNRRQRIFFFRRGMISVATASTCSFSYL
jgi:hypothetical protein